MATFYSALPAYIPPVILTEHFPAYSPSTSKLTRSSSNRVVYDDDPWNSARSPDGFALRNKGFLQPVDVDVAGRPRPRSLPVSYPQVPQIPPNPPTSAPAASASNRSSLPGALQIGGVPCQLAQPSNGATQLQHVLSFQAASDQLRKNSLQDSPIVRSGWVMFEAPGKPSPDRQADLPSSLAIGGGSLSMPNLNINPTSLWEEIRSTLTITPPLPAPPSTAPATLPPRRQSIERTPTKTPPLYIPKPPSPPTRRNASPNPHAPRRLPVPPSPPIQPCPGHLPPSPEQHIRRSPPPPTPEMRVPRPSGPERIPSLTYNPPPHSSISRRVTQIRKRTTARVADRLFKRTLSVSSSNGSEPSRSNSIVHPLPDDITDMDDDSVNWNVVDSILKRAKEEKGLHPRVRRRRSLRLVTGESISSVESSEGSAYPEIDEMIDSPVDGNEPWRRWQEEDEKLTSTAVALDALRRQWRDEQEQEQVWEAVKGLLASRIARDGWLGDQDDEEDGLGRTRSTRTVVRADDSLRPILDFGSSS